MDNNYGDADIVQEIYRWAGAFSTTAKEKIILCAVGENFILN
jgi:hypothetical protein